MLVYFRCTISIEHHFPPYLLIGNLRAILLLLLLLLIQVIDGETIREWLSLACIFLDGIGFSYPWELKSLGNYTLHGKDGVMNGFNAQFTMAVRKIVF